MSQALDGITLLEFASHPACAYAAMLLAEQGARTIRIEPPGGDPGRGGPHFAVLNRSKRSVILALDSAKGRAAARELLELADVVVNGFTPGQLESLDLTYDRIQAVNPRVVVLNMPPLGSRGPAAELAAGDELASAISGVTAARGGSAAIRCRWLFRSSVIRPGFWARLRPPPHCIGAMSRDRANRWRFRCWPERYRCKAGASCNIRS